MFVKPISWSKVTIFLSVAKFFQTTLKILTLLHCQFVQKDSKFFFWSIASRIQTEYGDFKAGDTRGARGARPLFCVSKRKKGNKEKRKSFKIEAIKRLSPRSKFYYFSHSRASRIQNFSLSANYGGRQYFSMFHDPSIFKSISPAPGPENTLYLNTFHAVRYSKEYLISHALQVRSSRP